MWRLVQRRAATAALRLRASAVSSHTSSLRIYRHTSDLLKCNFDGSKSFSTATDWVSAERRVDREVERQQAEDDIREEVAENQRHEIDEGSEEQLAPEVERLDPQSIPGLYPEFEAMENEEVEEAEEVEGDDSWYVDTSYGTTEEHGDQPLWQRRAAANLGRPVVNVSDFAA
ncbi:hypothetical protein IW150_003184, partial [Coemansia sp. RSA 2607]